MAQGVVPASVTAHNTTLLNELEEGDLLEFPRGAYSHWAVYIGNRAPDKKE